jgi:hypothetical protein
MAKVKATATNTVTKIDIKIEFGEKGQAVVNATATPQYGTTVDPTVEVIREILIKTLQAWDNEYPSIQLVVNKGVIQEDTSLNLPKMYFLNDILDQLNPKEDDKKVK